MHRNNINGRPDPRVPVNAVNALSAVRCHADSPFRQRTDTWWASRMTHVHLSGASWFRHVSLSCLSTFHLRVRPPVPSRFVTRAHMALKSVATCRRPVLTRGVVIHVHMSLLNFATCRRWPVTRTASVLFHMSLFWRRWLPAAEFANEVGVHSD